MARRRFPLLAFDTENNAKRLFLGSIDDSVLRYPWRGQRFDVDRFNRILIFYALIGPPLCCRLGNIIYEHRLLHLLSKDVYSPLMHLARSGFFQIQMREDSINKTIASRREIKTNTTLKFIDDYNWSAGSEIYRELDRIDGELQLGQGKLVYKPEFGKAFNKIVSQKISDNRFFLQVCDEWNRRFEVGERTRSNFEILCQNMLSDYEQQRQAMSVINSANHYAYGVGMTSFGIEALIETNELRTLRSLTKPILMGEQKKADPERLKELIELKVPQVIGRYLKIPDALFYSREHWAILSRLLTPGSDDYEDMLSYKQDLITKINNLSTDPSISVARKELEKSCRRYSRFLHSKLKISGSKEARYKFSMLMEQVSFKLTDQFIDEMPETLIKSLPEVAGLAVESVVPPLAIRGVRVVLSLTSEKGFEAVRRKIDDAVLGVGEDKIRYTEEIGEVIDTLSIKSIVSAGFLDAP